MLYALVDNIKCDATPQSIASCPCCENEVFSRCGDIRVWHWSHFKGATCDTWMERDSKWHKGWKNEFGKKYSEVVLRNGNEKHFADILTKDDVIIKLLSTTISEQKIKEMEHFYGKRMMWLVDGSKMLDFFSYYHKYDLNYLILNSLDRFYIRYPHVTVEDLDTLKNDVFPFVAKRLLKLALYAQNPIFIDFGTEYLLRIREFKETKRGKGNLVSRERFIEKYK